MLHTNYLAIDDKVNADLYFKKYKDFLNNVDKYDPTYYPKNSYQYNLELMHISLIKYFTSKKEIDSAQFYINKLDIENMTYDILISSDYYQLMTDFYEVKGDKEMYYAYKDSLVFTLEEMSKKNIVDNVDLNERINSFKVLLNKEDQKKNWFYIVCITLILSIIIIIYFIRRNLIIVKQKKIKEEQIVTLSNQVTNQNKINLKIKESENFINEIKSELKNITRMSESSDRKMKIHDLFIKIHHKSNTEKFEGSYEQLYLFSPSFFNNLKKEYPSLNKSELIVCFYINLNLKNSEISSLLDKSIRSIESTRYRIRKKLDLNNSNFNIKDTLSSL
jgi:DNA-binding CsgD family transcriptional regulator